MNLEFKKLMTARFLVTMGMQIQAVILGWQMYVLTQSPLYLGLVGLAEAIPALGFALHAGLIVDHSQPLRVLRFVLFTCLVSGVIMLIFHNHVWGLFAASLSSGLARAFTQPAMFAIVPRIVSREVLPKTSAWQAMTLQVGRVAGPALGGLLYGFIGMNNTSIVTCGFLLAALATSLLIHALPPLEASKRMEGAREALLKGLKYVWKHPILFPALSLDMISVFFGGVTALLPIYAAEILHIGPTGLGLLRGAPAVGAAIASFGMTFVDISKRAGRLLMGSVTGWGLCILVFALSQNFLLSLFALALSGFLDSISMVIRISAVQLSSPDSMRGRISSVNSIFISSSNELGEFESGVAAKLFGVVPAAVLGGFVCLGMVGLAAIIWPQLFRLNLNELKALQEENA